ncbi:hypothetical protein CWR43_27915 [Rhizobium sullae]|uniref:Uncharacterized protein n=1 Tax=Rhizobium sullae TaxID=50338 RepID=A0A2N0D2R9_RHISU|nr:hypothetical protein [Rhizobium sullae]PKA40411.1 hypothetical protein CWR43_27915 [Rhizobium sullae]
MSSNELPVAVKDIVERLKLQLPVCPYDRRSPLYYDEMPVCPVCRSTENGPDLCKSADTRIMDEAANLITSLRDQLAKAEAERDVALRKRNGAIGLRVQANASRDLQARIASDEEGRARRAEAMCADLANALKRTDECLHGFADYHPGDMTADVAAVFHCNRAALASYRK